MSEIEKKIQEAGKIFMDAELQSVERYQKIKDLTEEMTQEERQEFYKLFSFEINRLIRETKCT